MADSEQTTTRSSSAVGDSNPLVASAASGDKSASESEDNKNEGAPTPTTEPGVEAKDATKQEGIEDDDLEEGELKDDDDDDDDDDNEAANENGREDSSKLSSSSSEDSKSNDNKVSSNSDAELAERGSKREPESTRSPSPDDGRLTQDSFLLSYSSRHGSSSRISPRSHHSHSSRRRLSPIGNQQARLVSMRARLLEARSREIEMKFQKNKSQSASSTISSLASIQQHGLKTTVSKPPITYAENPNPVDVEFSSDSRDHSNKDKVESRERKRKRSIKRSKKKKKKSSSSRKVKKMKTTENLKKSRADDSKESNSNDLEPPFDNVDRQGPRTPPDNQVLTIDDKQIEWPSYLIKMTITQPSISYSVNPDSVMDSSSSDRNDTADLNLDYNWFYNYFLDVQEMDKTQAQHQALSALITSSNYDDDLLNKWLEHRGLSRLSNDRDEDDVFPPNELNDDQPVSGDQDGRTLKFRPISPRITMLKSQRETVLPNGKILPPGTIQKIVHPYPKTERVVPDVMSACFDLY